MKNFEKIIASAVRIEYSEQDGKLYIVFEVTDPQAKIDLKKNWTKDLEFRIMDKNLIEVNF